MNNKVKIVLEFDEDYFVNMVRDTDYTIKDEAGLREFLHSEKFANFVKDDLYQLYDDCNYDSIDWVWEFVTEAFRDFVSTDEPEDINEQG